MKRCPQCGREYDASMMFCLDDGAELLYGPASIDEPQTAILRDTDGVNEAATRAQVFTTDQTEVLPSGITEIPKAKSFDKRLLLAPLALALIVLVGFFGYRYSTQATQIESIAVMPFVNESGNPDVEYLSDGMTETLIKSLSNLPNLNVKPRSSVFRYKGKDTDLQTIGEELNVQAILTGRVVQRGEQLTLSLELVDVQKDRVIWTEQYNRKQSDLVSLQSEIAKDVSTKLTSKLTGEDETRITKSGTANAGAYQAYLKGRYYWNRRTGENLKKAIDQFKAATDRDPNYALAYAGLADCYALLPEYAGTPMSETIGQARSYADRAISIDDQLAEAHASLGQVYKLTWQWVEAEREYRRAIELNPNYPTTYHWYSHLLRNLGRYDEAAVIIQRAHELDPLSSIISVNLAEIYRFQNNHQAAVETCRKVIEIDPTFSYAYVNLGLSSLELGRTDEAIPDLEKATELSSRAGFALMSLGYAYGVVGKRTEAATIAKELEERYARNESAGVFIAAVYAGLGDKNKAFEWLEKDFQSKNDIGFIRWRKQFESLRDDPRFKDLLKRMNLPE